MMDPTFEVVVTDPGTLRLVGELDVETVSVLRNAIDTTPGNGPATLDLAELSFIDSAGLHAVMTYAESLDGGGPLTLANPTSNVAKVFEVVGLDKHAAIRIELR
jgi:anti-anti-sigma factor